MTLYNDCDDGEADDDDEDVFGLNDTLEIVVFFSYAHSNGMTSVCMRVMASSGDA